MELKNMQVKGRKYKVFFLSASETANSYKRGKTWESMERYEKKQSIIYKLQMYAKICLIVQMFAKVSGKLWEGAGKEHWKYQETTRKVPRM